MATSTNAILTPKMVSGLFAKVKGHSSLAKLSGQAPIAFNGNEIMTFSMDGEAAIVAEGAKKPAGEAAFKPVTITPIKFVYQHRVSDEFIHASEEDAIPYLQAFTDGFSVKIARAIDIAAIHGQNPIDGTAADSVSGKSFDTLITQKITYDAATADENIDSAVATILANDGNITGIAMSPDFGAAMAKIKVNGVVQYPEFRFGGNPESFAGYGSDINNTISFKESKDKAIIGDFAGAFRWGYAANVPLEVIQYGDPDGLGDLKRQNQVCLRAEAYVGWGILDPESFVRIVAAGE